MANCSLPLVAGGCDFMLYPRQAVGLTKSNKNYEILFKKMSNNELPVT
jgi:hypothetical protein